MIKCLSGMTKCLTFMITIKHFVAQHFNFVAKVNVVLLLVSAFVAEYFTFAVK